MTKNYSIVVIFFLSLLAIAYGQTPVKFSGKIVDAENSVPLAGALIVVQESGAKTVTDVEGRFFIQLQKGKKYTFKITSLGYAPKVVNDISAETGNTLDIVLDKDNGNQLEMVVIKSTSARKESAASIYLAQKNSSSISDGISAEVIKRSPDKSTGEVLKRVSGASVQDNKFVVIRGLNERYNTALLNNSVLPSTEPDKKAFSFDIIPSSLVDNLVIYKSPLPDLPGDFAGGAIKISTKDYPASKISELSFSASYNSMTTFKEFYKGMPDGSLDFLGFFDKKSQIPNPYYKRRGGAFGDLDAADKKAITKLFPNTYGYNKAANSIPNFSLSYTGGNTALLKKGRKLGYIYSLGYSTGHRVSDRNRLDAPGNAKQLDYDYYTTNYDQRNNLSALLNLTYSYGKSKIALKNIFNNDFTKTVALRNGLNYAGVTPIGVKSVNSEATGNGILNSVLEGTHKAGSNWDIDWSGSFGLTYRWQPDQRILAFRGSEAAPYDYFIKLSNENSPAIRDAGRVYSYLKEYIYGANVNVSRKFSLFNNEQRFKVGISNYYRTRNMEVIALGYSTINPSFGAEIKESKTTDFATMFSPENIDQYNLTLANIPTNSAEYKGTGLLNAGYLMFDNKFNGGFKLTWGARLENYTQKLTGDNEKNTKNSNLDILPSFLLTYKLTENTNLRLAGSRSVNRPEFREMASYSFYDYENNIVVKGAPNLKRATASNADLRYEWFPAAGEIMSASLFYKNFSNPIEQTNLNNDVYSYANADKANVYGAELEIRKKLGFFNTAFFDHLTFYANAAYMKGSVQLGGVNSNRPLQGQSSYLVNSGLTYATIADDLIFNVLYNKIGPRLRARAGNQSLDVYERPRDVIDFQVTKKLVSNKLELKVTISDILAQANQWYYKYDANPSKMGYDANTDKIINSVKYGTTATLAVRYNF
ncbi:Outer membrane receptor proteins, mostly Fe transport [Filimonas lacunae]|uniref:Outer membrane receptor proteins, mostly Fe transport n=1 Tax=Filimonas lacunae TaxID=477680 RepID=A0A173MP43_9BACT|nr:TonB-dependent receptor [Filimonas lacunae]BAV09256.1 TonB-dependent receptor [Filimonas lacunae]SIS69897.1 Outer membrane receptor proteins, mostly Fe transport [Filimonas lacunae]